MRGENEGISPLVPRTIEQKLADSLPGARTTIRRFHEPPLIVAETSTVPSPDAQEAGGLHMAVPPAARGPLSGAE